MNTTKSPEFDGWRWVSFWYPVRQVVSFKKDVYRKAMKEFAQAIFGNDKTLLENTQEHEINKPYQAPRKNSFSKYQKRHLINQGGNNAHFYPALFACRGYRWFSCRIIWHWRRIDYCANIGLFIADDGHSRSNVDVHSLGTSFATIVITGFSSAQRHHKLGNIVWSAVKVLAPVMMINGIYLRFIYWQTRS